MPLHSAHGRASGPGSGLRAVYAGAGGRHISRGGLPAGYNGGRLRAIDAGPVTNLDFELPRGYPNGLIIFVRDSARVTGRVGDGRLVTLADNVFEPDHDETGARIGTPYEGAATNLALRSDEFDDAVWVKNPNIAITADAVVSPDGTMNADAFTPDNAGGNDTKQTLVVSSGVKHTWSIYLEDGPSGDDWIELTVVSTSVWRAWFNPLTGVKGTSSGSPDAYEIEPAGNGWHRATITVTTGTTTADLFISCRPADGSTGAVGDGSTVHSYIWRSQFETGPVATSPIKTEGATVTRAAETVTIAHATIPEGTLRVKWSDTIPDGIAEEQCPVSVEADSSNYIRPYRVSTSSRMRTRVRVGGIDQMLVETAPNSALPNVDHVSVVAWKANDFAFKHNSEALLTDTSGTVPTIDKTRLGDWAGAQPIFGHILSFDQWLSRFPDAVVETLTP